MGIGKRIKQARIDLNLTRNELASMIGVSPSAISNYENGISHPKETVLYKLMDALQVDANFLFQDDIAPSSNKGPSTHNVHHLYPADTEEEATRQALQAYLRTMGQIAPDHELSREEALHYQEELGWPRKKGTTSPDFIEWMRLNLEDYLGKPVLYEQAENFLTTFKSVTEDQVTDFLEALKRLLNASDGLV